MSVTPVTGYLAGYRCKHCPAIAELSGGRVTVTHAPRCPRNPANRAARSARTAPQTPQAGEK